MLILRVSSKVYVCNWKDNSPSNLHVPAAKDTDVEAQPNLVGVVILNLSILDGIAVNMRRDQCGILEPYGKTRKAQVKAICSI